MTRELQKYNFVRRGTGEDDFNENITLDLGNPYRKKRKLSDDQRSINVSLTKNESGNNIPSVTASELEQLHNDNLVG